MDDDKLKQLEAISKSYTLVQPQAKNHCFVGLGCEGNQAA